MEWLATLQILWPCLEHMNSRVFRQFLTPVSSGTSSLFMSRKEAFTCNNHLANTRFPEKNIPQSAEVYHWYPELDRTYQKRTSRSEYRSSREILFHLSRTCQCHSEKLEITVLLKLYSTIFSLYIIYETKLRWECWSNWGFMLECKMNFEEPIEMGKTLLLHVVLSLLWIFPAFKH